MADFTFVQGNTRPYFAIIVKNVLTNNPVDLTGASVALYFKAQRARTAVVTGAACVVTDAPNGKIEYRWGANDLNTPGVYDADFRITFPDATVQSVIIPDVVVAGKLG